MNKNSVLFISCEDCGWRAKAANIILRKCIQCGGTKLVQPHIPRPLAPIFGFSNPSLPRVTRPKFTVDSDMSQPVFLYLDEEWKMKNWIEGGKNIPIDLASKHKSTERDGTKTPDENLINEASIDLRTKLPAISLNGHIKNLNICGNIFNGEPLPNIVIEEARIYQEDGLILCFSKTKSLHVCHRLKKKFCVQIDDMARLKTVIDSQIGMESTAGHCIYRADHQRNHFIKHVDDQWMDEFRLFWPKKETAYFDLPAGFAKQVDL